MSLQFLNMCVWVCVGGVQLHRDCVFYMYEEQGQIAHFTIGIVVVEGVNKPKFSQ